ncbi:paternally-expressed gene 3 protein-like [Sardina pilchardus]|uniref:paternally-expressed gene 3 protein-like n=1 Tax=Sardina pilchardus TaxID=27697 RepID=UPI002E0F87B2
MKIFTGMKSRIALLLLIVITHDAGLVDGVYYVPSQSSPGNSFLHWFSSEVRVPQHASGQQPSSFSEPSQSFQSGPTSVGQPSFLPQPVPTKTQPMQSNYHSGRPVDRNNVQTLQTQYSQGRQSYQQTQVNTKPVTFSTQTSNNPLPHQSLLTPSTSSSQSPRPQQMLYNPEPSNQKPLPVSRPVNVWNSQESQHGEVLSNTRPIQGNHQSSQTRYPTNYFVQHGSWRPAAATARPVQANYQSSQRTSASPVAQHVERPRQSEYLANPGQNWHQPPAPVSKGQFAKPEQSQQTSIPAQVNYHPSQTRYPTSSVIQQSPWNPAATARPSGHQSWRPSSVSGTQMQFKPPQNPQAQQGSWKPAATARPVQARPQQSEYLLKPGQNWQPSTPVSRGPVAKPEQRPQTAIPAKGKYQPSQTRYPASPFVQQSPRKPAAIARPVQANYQSSQETSASSVLHAERPQPSQTRSPASSVAQHMGAWSSASTAKPVYNWPLPYAGSNNPLSSMLEWRPPTATPSRTAQSNYQTSQSRFNNQALAQSANRFKPASPVHEKPRFSPSQSSRPSAQSGVMPIQSSYEAAAGRLQSGSRLVVASGTGENRGQSYSPSPVQGNRQQSPVCNSCPYAHPYASISQGVASGNSRLGQTKS